MSSRMKRFSLFAGFLLALFVTALSLPSASASSTFQNGQNVSLVLGNTDFNGSPPSHPDYYFTPRSIAVDPVSRKVFVSDMYKSRVLRFAKLADLSNGMNPEAVLGAMNFSSTFSSLAQNSLSFPSGLAFDSNGTLWVADSNNNRVLRFDNAASKANGANADAVLGQANYTTNSNATTQNGMRSPAGLAVDSQGRLWVTDSGNHRVLRFDNAASKANGANADAVLGQADFTTGLSATTQNGLSIPMGITVDTQGTLWVADAGNNRVLAFDDAANKANGANADFVLGQTGFTTQLTGTTQSTFSSPAGVAMDPEGNLWVADAINNRVLGFHTVANKSNGANADVVLGQANFTTNTQGLSQNHIYLPQDLAIDPSGSLWLAEFGNSRALLFSYQSISFTAPPNSKVGTSIALNATASSGLPITYQSSTPSICTISGSNANLNAVGTCTIIAKQAGNGGTIPAAADVQRSFLVQNTAPIT